MRKGYLPAAAVIILALITIGVAIVIYFNRDLILKTKTDQSPQPALTSPSPISKISPALSPIHSVEQRLSLDLPGDPIGKKGDEITVKGNLYAVDYSPGIVDGSPIMQIITLNGGKINIMLGSPLVANCKSQFYGIKTDYRGGEQVEVSGQISGNRQISLSCDNANHYIKISTNSNIGN